MFLLENIKTHRIKPLHERIETFMAIATEHIPYGVCLPLDKISKIFKHLRRPNLYVDQI